jgi:sigma-B regulation protein RsbU (phosphoserine phosphatase)
MNPAHARVLVVDDIDENRDILVRRLRRLGVVHIEQAVNGREALAAIEAREFDLVLLDIMMPEVDGFEVLRQLSEAGKLTDLPVIVISALNDMDPVVRCIEMGAEDFVLKPFNATLLRARILATLEKKMLRDSMRHELQRKQIELNDARALQLALVPPDYRGSHHGRDIAIDIVLEPAKEVGGDLVDYFLIGDDMLVMLIGDVSGKGAAAGLMMARTQALFRGLLSRPDVLEVFGQPERAAGMVHSILSRGNDSCMFVTMLLATLDLRSGKLSYVRAGHVEPFLIRADGAVGRLACSGGLPFGLMDEDFSYESTSVQLETNDQLLVVTDGVTEAMAPGEDMYGDDRVTELLAAHAGRSLLPTLVGAVREFEGGLAAFDDLAAIHLRFEAPDRPR